MVFILNSDEYIKNIINNKLDKFVLFWSFRIKNLEEKGYNNGMNWVMK